uniref:Uncharacterized protein n=1 Tax=Rhizophora mucronata TaxID=61149 RepID=A0A2P2QIL1_RHIMU
MRSKLHFTLYVIWIIFQCPELVQHTMPTMTFPSKGLNQLAMCLTGFLPYLGFRYTLPLVIN